MGLCHTRKLARRAALMWGRVLGFVYFGVGPGRYIPRVLFWSNRVWVVEREPGVFRWTESRCGPVGRLVARCWTWTWWRLSRFSF